VPRLTPELSATSFLKMPPSEYRRGQCYATYQIDPVGVKLIDEIGEDNMWGSDFPHADGVVGIYPARAGLSAGGYAQEDHLRRR
jgi:hypothetical protein